MKITSFALAAGLGTAFAVSSIVPAQALQIAPPQVERQASSGIVQAKAKWKHRRGHWHGHRHYRYGYRHGHRHHGGRYYGWGWPFWIAPTIVIAP
jgi:ABC-type nickel/cobalt efflux system permease component RcnA